MPLQSIVLKRHEPDFVSGLSKVSFEWGDAPITPESAELVDVLSEQYPDDGREVVPWMREAAADSIVFEAFEDEYNTCSAKNVPVVSTASGDGNIPGVRVAGISSWHVSGSYVRSIGGTYVYTPRGRFFVRLGRKATFAKQDVLAWAVLPRAYAVQYVITLLRYVRIAETPINKRVRFPSSYGRVAPIFFKASPRIPAPVTVLRIGITSDRKQTIVIRGRGTEGNYHNVLFEDKFDVDKGESEVAYVVNQFPYVNMTIELQPEDGTKTILDYVDTIP